MKPAVLYGDCYGWWGLSASELLNLMTTNGLVIIRNAAIDEEMQISIAKNLGDISGWVPSSRVPSIYMYRENHSLTFRERATNPRVNEELLDENVLVSWHLEHICRVPRYVAAIWRMHHFSCASTSGMTGFVDAQEILNCLSKEELAFLNSAQIAYVENGLVYDSVVMEIGSTRETCVPAIDIHPLTGREICRLTPSLHGEQLCLVDGSPPSIRDGVDFAHIKNKLVKHIWTNKSFQFWWSWREGDVMLVDLLRMYHCVSGGFAVDTRLLVGIHCTEM